MTIYGYLGTDEALAAEYARVWHDLVCTDDMVEYQRLIHVSHTISSQIVQRFMENAGYSRNGLMLWTNTGNNGEYAARGRRAESEENNENTSKNRSESKSADTQSE